LTTVKFIGDDYRWLLETLVEVCEITDIEGVRPTVVINGKQFSDGDLSHISLLMPDEDLQPHHRLMVESLIKTAPRDYRRGVASLAHLANAISCAARSVGARRFLAEMRRQQSM
jgi:hypothetical protein